MYFIANSSTINAMLSRLTYISTSNADGYDIITFVVFDEGNIPGTFSTTAADRTGLSVYSKGMNDRPQVFGVASIGIATSTVLPLRDIYIFDPDGDDGVQVSVSATHGVFKLSDANSSALERITLANMVTGEVFTGDYESAFTFYGALEDVNTVLYGMKYQLESNLAANRGHNA